MKKVYIAPQTEAIGLLGANAIERDFYGLLENAEDVSVEVRRIEMIRLLF